ncbi:MAG TPA: histidine kinase dimerization/phospho-acceptor domain-containing protein, partial [Blastocatellia bacterium]|nr:histidine kinase dimerization/phospho-acceptor domain-containing protein [Blastocatellia bacterium]
MSTGSGSDQILVVGDEAKSARAVGRLLQAVGYHTAVVETFDSARDSLSGGRICLIVIDLSASKISGPYSEPNDWDSGQSFKRQTWANEALAFCRAIRTGTATADLPILVISKSQRAQDKVAALNAGASDYIIKPYQKGELLSRVKVHLRSWRYERDIADRFEELNVLHAVSTVLASSLEPEVLIGGTLSVIAGKAWAGPGIVFLCERDAGTVKIAASHGIELSDDDRDTLLEMYLKVAPLMNGKPILLDPVPSAVRSRISSENLASLKGLLCAPLGLKGDRVGALWLLSLTDGPFADRLPELLSTTCNQLSVALENSRLYIETKKSASQLAFVYNLGNNLMTTLEMDELLGYAVFSVGKTLECDICAVIVRAAHEPEELASAIYNRVPTDGQSQSSDWCYLDRVAQYLESARGSIRTSIESRSVSRFLKDERVAAENIVPLVFDDIPLGVLVCATYASRELGDDERRLLGAVAQQLSLAIRNTELFQRSKDTSINLAVEVSRRTSEIEEQKRFTEKIIDSLPVSLYVVDRDMRIVAWNRNREVGGSGLTRMEVLGRNVFQVFSRQPRRTLEQEFLDVFRTGEIVNMEQESWIDGVKKCWRISKIPMRVGNAEVSHVITVGEDITEQKKMNDAVIHAEKLASIGRLAAGVVHELNNPLATIAACTEALTTRVDNITDAEMNKDFAEYLEIIREEAFRCKTINNSLLDFSHQRQAEKMA